MKERLYYQKPDIKEFNGKVVSCVPGKEGRYEVILDQSAFYPEGGGQPADTGYLDGAAVLDVHEKDGKVVHTVDRELFAGTTVHGVIDWERRYVHMQQHSGEHLFSGLVHRTFGYNNVGFHMGQGEVTVDFDGPLTMEQAEELEREANGLIYANVPVLERYPSPEELKTMEYRSKKELSGEVRIIEIPGGDVCACCGTHVSFTGEIGIIKITGLMKYKGGVRLTMQCGYRALLDYEMKQNQIQKISVLLSVKPEETGKAVEKLKAEIAAKDAELAALFRQILKLRVSQFPSGNEPLLVVEHDLTPVQIREYCTELYEQGKGDVVLVCSGEGKEYRYVLGSAAEDMRKVSKALNGLLCGRGGGNQIMAQGTFHASEEEIARVWKDTGSWRQ